MDKFLAWIIGIMFHVIIAVVIFSTFNSSAMAKTILLMGDSLSSGYGIDIKSSWVKTIQNDLKQEMPAWQLINASIAGDTSQNGLNRLPALLSKYQPELVLIELGGNDGLRGGSLKLLKNNLSAMIELSQSAGARVILFAITIPPNYGHQYISRFEQIYQDLSRQKQLVLVPFLLETVASDPALMQADGIHPNEQAQPFIARHVRKHLFPAINKAD